TGDLTHRKLVPALYSVSCGGLLTDGFAVVGFARRDWTADTFRSEMRAGVNEFSRRRPVTDETWERFGPNLDFVPGEFDDSAAYQRLKARLEELDRTHGTRGNRLFYLATPPANFAAILKQLQAAGMIARPFAEPWTRVILEKPFGRDYESAVALNSLVAKVLDESQTFRIDHYLGK